MEIIEKLKTNKSIDNETEIQKICLDKLQSSPLPNPRSEQWRLSNKSKLSNFLDYSINVNNSKFHIPYCLLYTSPSPRDISGSRMPSSA